MKKKILLIPVALLLVISLVVIGCPAPPPAEEEEVPPPPPPPPEEQFLMRYGGISPPSWEGNVAIANMAEKVEKLTNGQLKMECYFGGALGSGEEMVLACSAGALEATGALLGYNAGYLPWLTLAVAPYTFRDVDDAVKFCEEALYPTLNKELEQYDLYFPPGGVVDSGFRYVLSRMPITSLADLQGKKIRLMAAGILSKHLEYLGAKPLVMPFGEVPSALETGAIDALLLHPTGIYSTKLYEPAPYVLGSKHMLGYIGYYTGNFEVCKSWWDSLPADIQEVVLECLAEAFTWANAEQAKNEAAQIEEMVAAGATFTYLTPEATEEFRPAAMQAWEWAREEYGDIVDLWLDW